MLCLGGFELSSRWVPLESVNSRSSAGELGGRLHRCLLHIQRSVDVIFIKVNNQQCRLSDAWYMKI